MYSKGMGIAALHPSYVLLRATLATCLCGVPLVGCRYLKCGLGRPNDIRILRGPFEKRRDRPLERPAQIGEGIFDSQSSRCKHRSRYKAALFQAPQTLNQALLRKTRNVAADSVDPPPVAVIAQ